jgi:SAM-dependent MidA family methyltransferase
MTTVLDHIRQSGPMPFDQYMALALYHPEYGYYNKRVAFNEQGDFITAPTLTATFARTLGNFLLNNSKLENQAIIELGPGNGQLAYQLLLFFAEKKIIPKAYYLVETSAYLKKQQQELLNTLPNNLRALVKWQELSIIHEPQALIIGNEFIDALPVARFSVTEQGIKEIYVEVKNQKLSEVLHEARPELLTQIAPLNLPVGYNSECCLGYAPLAQQLSLISDSGLLLIIDYGYVQNEYYQAARTQGTLQGYYQHQAMSDYLAHPSMMDLTAHVNYTYLIKCLLQTGFSLEFFTYQNVFLLEHGIHEYLAQCPLKEQQKIKRLIDPRLMGEAFKVLAMSKNNSCAYQPSYDLTKFL